MAVVYVYCRQAIHDAYFFERPQELLGAPIRPPRFNLKNDVLVRKHVHAAVLSELLRIARDDEDAQQALARGSAAVRRRLPVRGHRQPLPHRARRCRARSPA